MALCISNQLPGDEDATFGVAWLTNYAMTAKKTELLKKIILKIQKKKLKIREECDMIYS